MSSGPDSAPTDSCTFLCLNPDGNLSKGASGSFNPAQALLTELCAWIQACVHLEKRRLLNSHEGSVHSPSCVKTWCIGGSGSAGTLVSLGLVSSDDSWESSKPSHLAPLMPVLFQPPSCVMPTFSLGLCWSFYLECSLFHLYLANCHSSFYHSFSSFSLAVSSFT